MTPPRLPPRLSSHGPSSASAASPGRAPHSPRAPVPLPLLVGIFNVSKENKNLEHLNAGQSRTNLRVNLEHLNAGKKILIEQVNMLWSIVRGSKRHGRKTRSNMLPNATCGKLKLREKGS